MQTQSFLHFFLLLPNLAVLDFLKVFLFFFFRRGSLLSTAIFVYAATAPVNGYAGGSLYARMGGKKWIRQVSLEITFCSLPHFLSSRAESEYRASKKGSTSFLFVRDCGHLKILNDTKLLLNDQGDHYLMIIQNRFGIIQTLKMVSYSTKIRNWQKTFGSTGL